MSTVCARCAAPLVAGVCAGCFAGADEPFELLARIGQGGMGEVWRARHRVLGREVALKFLSEELAARPGFKARFEKEARLLARVRHPGVVEVFEVGEMEGSPYIAMALAEGRPLNELCPMPAARAVTVARELAEALGACHAAGVVHRDVKPANVIVGARAVLVDFGIAWGEGEAAGTLTRAGMVMGTPAYVAPEVLDGRPPDARADVYALGALLHQLLTGQVPVGALAPTPHAALIRRAMAPWEARIPDMATFAAELRAIEAAEVSGELPPEELTLQRAGAAVLTVASALMFLAALECVTPKVVSERQPLVMQRLEALADGRLVSYARFEVGAVLGAVGGLALGAVVWALLLGHWRRSGLLVRGGRVPQVRLLAGLVLGTVGWAALRWGLASDVLLLGPFGPVLGGLLETACLAVFWMGQLERARRGLTIPQAWPLTAWMALALVPPIVTLASYLQNWRP